MDGIATARRLADWARELLDDCDEQAALHAVAASAVPVIGAGGCASVSQWCHGRLVPAAASSPVAEAADTVQCRQQAGPAVEAATRVERCHVPDLAEDPQWPAWSHPASEMGLRSALAVRLFAAGRTLGVLTVYDEQPHAFTEDDVELAALYATHAAVALFAVMQAAHLTVAVDTRHAIGVAQGILMNRYDLTLQRAFELLRRYSNGTNTKLLDVARRVAEHGDLPALTAR